MTINTSGDDMSDTETRDEISGILREVAWHTASPEDAAADIVTLIREQGVRDAAERTAYLAQALADLYAPEGVGTWWRSWLKADADRRAVMERNVIFAADGAFA